MTARCRITKVELSRCEIEGIYADWIAGALLAQCRALVHLDLSGTEIGCRGAGIFAADALPVLAHKTNTNAIKDDGKRGTEQSGEGR